MQFAYITIKLLTMIPHNLSYLVSGFLAVFFDHGNWKWPALTSPQVPGISKCGTNQSGRSSSDLFPKRKAIKRNRLSSLSFPERAKFSFPLFLLRESGCCERPLKVHNEWMDRGSRVGFCRRGNARKFTKNYHRIKAGKCAKNLKFSVTTRNCDTYDCARSAILPLL